MIDAQGSVNGSSFTITVKDTDPHFYYPVYLDVLDTNCSALISTSDRFNSSRDVIFVLNPNSLQTSDGYRKNGISEGNVPVTFTPSPRGGQLLLKSFYSEISSSGFSEGQLAAGVIVAAIGGLAIGVLMGRMAKRFCFGNRYSGDEIGLTENVGTARIFETIPHSQTDAGGETQQ